MAIITIFPSGYIKVGMSWEEEYIMTKRNIANYVLLVNELIRKINKLGAVIFFNNSYRQLRPLITDINNKLPILSLNTIIVFPPGNYTKFIKFLNNYAPIITKDSSGYEMQMFENIFLLRLYRPAHTQYHRNAFEDENTNLSTINIACSTKLGSKIHIKGASSFTEIKKAEKILIQLISIFLSTQITKNVEESNAKNKRKLRRLQILDAKTYAYATKYSGFRAYAKICQNTKQPYVITPEEFSSLSSDKQNQYTALHNASKPGTMLYYSCVNNENHKFVSFLKKSMHPEGNCMACCSVIDPKKLKNTKINKLYNSCIDKQLGNVEIVIPGDVKYITTYSDKIPTGRITNLPNVVEKLLNSTSNISSKMHIYKLYGISSRKHTFIAAIYFCIHSNLDLGKEINEYDIKQFTNNAISFIKTKYNFAFLGNVTDLYNSFEAYIKDIVDELYSPKKSVLMCKILFELYTNHNIIVLNVKNDDVFLSYNLQCKTLLKTRNTIVIIQTLSNRFYPICLLSAHQYHTGYIKVIKILQTVFNSNDTIIQHINEIINWSAPKVTIATELLELKQSAIRQFVNKKDILLFIETKQGDILPCTGQINIDIPVNYILKFEDIVSPDALSLSFVKWMQKLKVEQIIVNTNDMVIGFLLQSKLIAYVVETPLNSVEKKYGKLQQIKIDETINFKKINNSILQQKIYADNRINQIAGLQISIELYNLLKLNFAAYVSKQRNENERAILYKLLSETKSIPLIHEIMSKSKLLEHEVKSLLKDSHYNKSMLVELINQRNFNFDNIIEREIQKVIHDKYKVGEIVKKIVDKICIVQKNIERTIFPFDTNIRFTCNEINSQNICLKNKLILSSDEYKICLARLITEIYSNQFIREMLMSGIIPRSVNPTKYYVSEDNILIIVKD
jgi:hypothetical protein